MPEANLAPSLANPISRYPRIALEPAQKPKFLDRLREALRFRHYSRRTEQSYCQWVKRFIFFHNKRHPVDMAEAEINAFLSDLAVKDWVSASTQTQALSALIFLYRHVLGKEIGTLEGLIRARKPRRLPVVLTRDEVRAVIGELDGQYRLMAGLMYGAGLRLMECLRLRVQDLDFAASQITVRDGRGAKDRLTMLSQAIKVPLMEHLKSVQMIHQRDLQEGWGRVFMPDALARKYPNAAAKWGWQWVFPQENRWVSARTGEQGRHHAGRIDCAKGGKGGSPQSGNGQTRNLPYIPAFFCHPFAPRWV